VATNDYAKLVGFDDASDEGIYYRESGVAVYPQNAFAAGRARPGERHDLAFVFTGTELVDVYYQGEHVGQGSLQRGTPPTSLTLFRDDGQTSRSETLVGVVEAVRISSVDRSAAEIAATAGRVKSMAPLLQDALPPALPEGPGSFPRVPMIEDIDVEGSEAIRTERSIRLSTVEF